jgi:hypothetical protein
VTVAYVSHEEAIVRWPSAVVPSCPLQLHGVMLTTLFMFHLQDFITPLIAAIFAGSNFAELYFELNGSKFKYGEQQHG